MTNIGSKARIIAPASSAEGMTYGQSGYAYNQPGLAYNQPSGTYDQTGIIYDQPGATYDNLFGQSRTLHIFGSRASIINLPGQHVYVQARLRKKFKPFQQSRARVSNFDHHTIGVKSRIVHLAKLNVQADIKNTVRQHLSIHMSVRNTVHHSFKMKARIVFENTFTAKARVIGAKLNKLNAKARILKTEDQALRVKGRMISTRQDLGVKAKISHDLGMKARLAIRQGWPIPSPSGGNFRFFTDTRNRVRARITPPKKASQKLGMKAKLRWIRQPQLEAKAKISTGQYLGMQALIRPYKTQIAVPVTYNVTATEQKRVRAVFYTQGNYVSPSMGMGAFIAVPTRKRVTAHFIVTKPASTSPVQSISTIVSGNASKQTFGSLARITK